MIGATPYSLVYGMEVVLPIEVEIPSLRVLREVELEEAEWVQARYEQLNLRRKNDEGYLSWSVVPKENDESS